MGILTSQDKEKIKRVIPSTNNKIIDATVARLYIAYPDPTSWVYTDLVGAIVFVDDLVGHTFFLKMVDIIGNRGVIWDQELYIDFDYNQDRTFFHTFELEDCLAGLLFEDTSEATHFFKRVSARKKYGSKKTVNNKTAIAMKKTQRSDEPMRPGPRGEYVDVNTAQRSRRSKGILYYDDEPPPEWKPLYAELAAAGITEDMIADNREFIKSYIAQQGGPLVGLEPPIPRSLSQPISKTQPTSRISSASSLRSSKKAPPPPPSSYEKPSSNSLSTHANATSHSADSGRSTPSADDSLSADSHEPLPEPKSLETFKPVFRVPPPNAAIPNTNGHMVSGSSQQPTELPPSQETKNNPPPLPSHSRPLPSTPGRVHNVPPPPPSRSMVQPPAPPPRASNGPPPPAPPRRGGVPPPPPPRASRGPPPPLPPSRSGFKSSTVPETYVNNNTPPAAQRIPPPLPKYGTGLAPSAPDAASPPPTIPARSSVQSQAQPPVQASKVSSSPVPPPPPPAPPAPMMQSPSTVQRATGGIPPPPPPGPPPPTSASSDSGSTPPLPQPDGSRDALLASIRGAGGIGSLKKTDKSQIDKPSVILQEAHGETPVSSNPGGGSQAGGPPGSLADALASALNKRKDKIAKSDDEEDEDW